MAAILIRLTEINRTLREVWPLLIIVAMCSALEVTGQSGREALCYQRELILQGQIWRLLTGNLVHLGPAHLAMDMAGLVLLWMLVGVRLRGIAWLSTALAGCATVGLGLLIFSPGVHWYVGFSGAINALWFAGALLLVVGREGSIGWPLLAFLIAKLIWEHWMGPLPFSARAAGGPVIAQAHLYGIFGGVPLVVWRIWRMAINDRQNAQRPIP